MNPLVANTSATTTATAARTAACMLVVSCLAAACGNTIDGDNASIDEPQEAGPLAIRPAPPPVQDARRMAPSSPSVDRHVALPDRPCEVGGRIVCSMPRLRARALHDEWIALHYQWRRDGADIPGATRASYVPDDTDAGTAGTHYSVAVTDGAGRTYALPGVVGTHTRLASR